MLWLALGALLLAAFVWLGRASSRGEALGGWRVAAGVLGVAALLGAAVLAVRGSWLPAAVLAVGAFAAAALSRRPPRQPRIEMSDAEARGLLGVGPHAGAEEVQAAYVRLMRRVHPDAGGATGLAERLNAARDRLLKSKR